MKKLSFIIFLLIIMLTFCSCQSGEATKSEQPPTSKTTTEVQNKDNKLASIVGTWVSNDIDNDLYFIFEENGDAFVKYGSCTIYGEYYDTEDDNGNPVYDIDLGEFLYNEYSAKADGEKLILKSPTNEYKFRKAEFYDVVLPQSDSTKIDEKLLGNWGSQDNFECYEFRADGTATVTDMYNMATIECVYECDNGTVVLTYLATETQTGTKKYEYSVDGNTAVIDKYNYEKVE